MSSSSPQEVDASKATIREDTPGSRAPAPLSWILSQYPPLSLAHRALGVQAREDGEKEEGYVLAHKAETGDKNEDTKALSTEEQQQPPQQNSQDPANEADGAALEAATTWSNISTLDIADDHDVGDDSAQDPTANWDEEVLDRRREEGKRQRVREEVALRQQIREEVERCVWQIRQDLDRQRLMKEASFHEQEWARVDSRLVRVDEMLAGLGAAVSTQSRSLMQVGQRCAEAQVRADETEALSEREVRKVREAVEGLREFQARVEGFKIGDMQNALPKAVEWVIERTKVVEDKFVLLSKNMSNWADERAKADRTAYETGLSKLEKRIEEVYIASRQHAKLSMAQRQQQRVEQDQMKKELLAMVRQTSGANASAEAQKKLFEEAQNLRNLAINEIVPRMNAQQDMRDDHCAQLKAMEDQLRDLTQRIQQTTERMERIEADNKALSAKEQSVGYARLYETFHLRFREIEKRASEALETVSAVKTKQGVHDKKLKLLSDPVTNPGLETLEKTVRSLEKKIQDTTGSIKDIWAKITDKIEPSLETLQQSQEPAEADSRDSVPAPQGNTYLPGQGSFPNYYYRGLPQSWW